MSGTLFDDEPGPLKPRQGKAIPAGGRALTIGNRATIARTVRRTPEVMVKISSSGKNQRDVGRNVDYISRQGTVAIEDEQGHQYLGEHAKTDALYTWGRSIPATGSKRRETFNIIFSMPAGTPRDEVTEAVRRFTVVEFANHQYLFATHNDEDHPHVHMIVKASPLTGRKRLNPRKADLQRWRERFAEELRGLGIEANATPRAARGVVRRPDKQAVIHINDRARFEGVEPAEVTLGQVQAAIDALEGKIQPEPFREALMKQRRAVLHEYGTAARQLVKGDAAERQLAVEITRFAQTLPPVQTQHDQRVASLAAQRVVDRGPER